jgi:hypothetical protein
VAGLKQNVTATGTYSDGTMLDVTNQVVWSTDDAMVATVSNAMGINGWWRRWARAAPPCTPAWTARTEPPP